MIIQIIVIVVLFTVYIYCIQYITCIVFYFCAESCNYIEPIEKKEGGLINIINHLI